MKTTGLEKTYPELSGLSYELQKIILAKAKHEVSISGGKSLVLGLKPILLGTLVAVIVIVFLMVIFGPGEAWDWAGPMIGAILGITFTTAVNNYNIKILRPKVRELAMKEKLKA
jgi:hypothetical protein